MIVAEMQDRRRFNEVLFQSYEGTSTDRLNLLALQAKLVARESRPRNAPRIVIKGVGSQSGIAAKFIGRSVEIVRTRFCRYVDDAC